MARKLINVSKLDRDEWRMVRQNGIGGSDIGAIMGFNKWSSPLTVWLQKTGELPPSEENMYMKMGHLLEPVVANLFAEEHPELKVLRNNFLLQHDTIDCMLANIDRELVCAFRGRGILEVKTASDWNKHLWTETSVPESYMLQLQHYLAVTGYRFGYFAVLIGGNDYRSYYVERDDELIAMIEAKAVEFWQLNIEIVTHYLELAIRLNPHTVLNFAPSQPHIINPMGHEALLIFFREMLKFIIGNNLVHVISHDLAPLFVISFFFSS